MLMEGYFLMRSNDGSIGAYVMDTELPELTVGERVPARYNLEGIVAAVFEGDSVEAKICGLMDAIDASHPNGGPDFSLMLDRLLTTTARAALALEKK